jgi:tRNA modification GTPase
VTAVLAFDGWPVELSDTAGLHASTDALESAGILKAEEQLRLADLILWVKDATAEHPTEPLEGLPVSRCIVVWNKCDLSPHPREGLAVSAQTRDGISELIAAIVSRLVPQPPLPLEGMPFSPVIADRIEQAWQAFTIGNTDASRAILAELLTESSAIAVLN